MSDAVTISIVFIHIIINSLGNSLGKNSPLEQKTVPLQSLRDVGICLKYLKLCLFKLVLSSIGLFDIFYWERKYIEKSEIHSNLLKIRQEIWHERHILD